ncbi:hypothetical protein EMIHUDRAFT_451580 [Emiliania huxleyi CCMP1516]|uniref:HEAT repeat-containing protein 1 n=4 Tax=Emiliania huxleyi TaxID=2903 RepID=A0A0D3IXH3_EMIH1|nr:hypothetical protein EMIHUDRAFT_451580 [Emiliania huxleyi CCMP1516]EOD15958.1 hypothetical protein EMIHUDRAFT_451580 [Emiliania huxleyi CCMP1516]|eukprot:XP_005768387.1 hypothetical protein EMIHUDRAFT_451580 [Emiliania huxleyi CCMP1516]
MATPRRVPTILFASSVAAEQDETFVHSLGLNGLLELIAADASFAPYEQTLFAESALQYSRRMQTAEQNGKLDRRVEGFLNLLSAHFLSQAAQKALEYLLRHFRDTELLGQLTYLGAAHRVAASFSAVALLEIASRMRFTDAEAPLLRSLLEHAREGIASETAPDRRLVGMMLITQLAARRSLAADPAKLLAALVGARLRRAREAEEARGCLHGECGAVGAKPTALRALLDAVAALSGSHDVSTLIPPLLLQLAESSLAHPKAAAGVLRALPVRNLARPVAALLASLEASPDTHRVAQWLWDTLCGGGAREASASSLPGDELSAIERLRAGADALTRAVLRALSEARAPRLALVPVQIALAAAAGSPPTLKAALSDLSGAAVGAVGAADEVAALCALLMQPTSEPQPLLAALLAALARLGGGAPNGASPSGKCERQLRLACDACLHLLRRLRATDGEAAALRGLIERVVGSVLSQLPPTSVASSADAVAVCRKALVVLLECGAGSKEPAALRSLLPRHWRGDALLLHLASCWASPERLGCGGSSWRATRLQALQMTRALLLSRAKETAPPATARAAAATAQRLLPLLLSVVHGSDALLRAAASATLRAMREACSNPAQRRNPPEERLPPTAGLQGGASPLRASTSHRPRRRGCNAGVGLRDSGKLAGADDVASVLPEATVLAVELIRAHDVRAFAALPAREKVASLAVLLRAVGLPWGKELPLVSLAVPMAALRQLTAGLFTSLPEADREHLLTALCESRRHALLLLPPPLVDPERPQVAKHALEVVKAAVPLLPEETLERVVPHFASVSRRALQHEHHGAALAAVERAVGVLVPLFVRRGLQLRPLLRGWVTLVLQAPPAQWPALLGALVGKASSDEHLHCVVSSLLEAMLALQALLPAGCLQPITTLLAHAEPAVQNLAVLLLQARLQRGPGKLLASAPEEPIAQMTRRLVALSGAAAASPSSQRAALLALDLLARECGAAMPQLFDPAVPAVVRLIEERDPLVLSSALLACSALVSSLGVRLVPHMPLFMPPLLRCLEHSLFLSEPQRDALLAAAAWLDGCGPALLTALPMFLHPYLPRLLRAVLRLASIDSPAAQAVGLAAKAKALNRALARAVPSRQLLPAMVDAVGVASQAGSAAQVELLQLLQTHVTLRPPAEARTHAAAVFDVLLSGLHFRSLQPFSEALLLAPPAAVEAATSAALAEIVMRLDEDSFGAFFERSLAWVAPAGVAGAASAPRFSLARALSFFRVLSGTQIALRSLFAPYFSLALPHACVHLGSSSPQQAAVQSTGGGPAKRRRLDRLAGSTGASAGEAELEVALTLAVAAFLEVGFANEAATPPAPQLRALEKALIARLGWAKAGPIEYALLAAVASLAAALGVDGCKVLHYELCVASQDDDEAMRRGAVKGLQRLYASVPDAAIVHSPEAVPFLSELLEDADAETRSCALELMNTLEQSNTGLLEEE